MKPEVRMSNSERSRGGTGDVVLEAVDEGTAKRKGSASSEPGTFTRYVQEWEPGREPEPALAAAVCRAVARGDLAVVAGSAKIGGATVLTVADPAVPGEIAPAEKIAEIARRWNDRLMPDLVTASRADKRRLLEEIARRFADLGL